MTPTSIEREDFTVDDRMNEYLFGVRPSFFGISPPVTLSAQGVTAVVRFSSDNVLAEVGDYVAPLAFEVEVYVDTRPTYRLAVKLIDGSPACTEFAILATTERPSITDADMRGISVAELVNASTKMVASVFQGSARRPLETMPDLVDLSTFKTKRRVRRTIDSKLLSRVAEIYNATEYWGVDAVMSEFEVSKSSAIRYINMARDKGYIPPRGAK